MAAVPKRGTPTAVARIGQVGGSAELLALSASLPPVLAQATGSLAPGFVADQLTFSDTGELRGLAATACPAPGSDFWFVGGGSGVGRTSTVVLANTEDAGAQVDVLLWGPDGPLAAPGGSRRGGAGAQPGPAVHVGPRAGRAGVRGARRRPDRADRGRVRRPCRRRTPPQGRRLGPGRDAACAAQRRAGHPVGGRRGVAAGAVARRRRRRIPAGHHARRHLRPGRRREHRGCVGPAHQRRPVQGRRRPGRRAGDHLDAPGGGRRALRGAGPGEDPRHRLHRRGGGVDRAGGGVGARPRGGGGQPAPPHRTRGRGEGHPDAGARGRVGVPVRRRRSRSS